MAERYHQPLYLLDKMAVEDVLGFFFHAAQRARAGSAPRDKVETVYCDQVDWL